MFSILMIFLTGLMTDFMPELFTSHAATRLTGTGLYDKEERSILYSVVYSNEVTPLINATRLVLNYLHY
jgi:uncharacterized membrane-anchored protein YitT (DUF2179 family)